jgi:glycerol-3-phosphate O-acyltransferase
MALPKIAFEVAVQANKVAPFTLPAIGCMVLLGAAPRALTLREILNEITALARWGYDRGIRLTSDFSRDRRKQVQELTDAMVDAGLLIRYDEGSDTVFGIEPDKHPLATYYRNTIIHHFVNKAILELALLSVSELEADDALDAFWRETLRLRDCFKFEFFYPAKKEFKKQLREEMKRVDPVWRARIGSGGAGVRALLRDMQPMVAHSTLLPYVEAYSVVFDLLGRLDSTAGMTSEECVASALKEGKQLYLQRRITSEASIGKILFQNGYQLAANLGLTESGRPNAAEGRARLMKEFKDLSRRLEAIRLIALSSHGE